MRTQVVFRREGHARAFVRALPWLWPVSLALRRPSVKFQVPEDVSPGKVVANYRYCGFTAAAARSSPSFIASHARDFHPRQLLHAVARCLQPCLREFPGQRRIIPSKAKSRGRAQRPYRECHRLTPGHTRDNRSAQISRSSSSLQRPSPVSSLHDYLLDLAAERASLGKASLAPSGLAQHRVAVPAHHNGLSVAEDRGAAKEKGEGKCVSAPPHVLLLTGSVCRLWATREGKSRVQMSAVFTTFTAAAADAHGVRGGQWKCSVERRRKGRGGGGGANGGESHMLKHPGHFTSMK